MENGFLFGKSHSENDAEIPKMEVSMGKSPETMVDVPIRNGAVGHRTRDVAMKVSQSHMGELGVHGGIIE